VQDDGTPDQAFALLVLRHWAMGARSY
jgi:hypothetical protein